MSEDNSVEKLLEKSVTAIEMLSKQNAQLRKDNEAIRKEFEALKKTAYVKDDAKTIGDIENPGKNVENDDDKDNFPAAEASTKPVNPTTGPAPVMNPVAKSVDIDALVAKAVDERMAKLAKSSTPSPWGIPESEEARLAMTDPVAFIRKAIDIDRAACGGSFNTTEGNFGFKSGKGDDSARTKTALYLRKAVN